MSEKNETTRRDCCFYCKWLVVQKNRGFCMYGNWLKRLLFKPEPVPSSAWCNRFDLKEQYREKVK